jgi:8-amino-7-oxononanoate synthase
VSWYEWAKARNAAISETGRWRQVRDLDAGGHVGRLDDGREVVSFASNDYLGLTQHPAVLRGAREALERWGAGSGAARLIVGSRPIHSELERALADWKQEERALLFPTGFAANLGVLSTLGHADAYICSDELNHASIVDGCRMAAAEVAVYPHADVEAADALLAKTRKRGIVVSDSVFSMDGDLAPIDGLMEVCARHDALLILDEAHAVLGPHPGRAAGDRIRVGTLSKFLGAMGGYVAADEVFIDLLTNLARPFIFTTASSPADAGAALAALGLLRSDGGDALIARLRANVDLVAPGHPSPIVPIVIGEEDEAVAISRRLLELGYLVPAIRPPSVPPGTSRLRLTLSAAHTEEQIDGLLKALRRAGAPSPEGRGLG